MPFPLLSPQAGIPGVRFTGGGDPSMAMGCVPESLMPEAASASCSCGRARSVAEAHDCTGAHGRRPIVFGRGWMKEVSVYKLVCRCGVKAQYDGGQHHILNLNNLDLFTHDLLRWYVPVCMKLEMMHAACCTRARGLIHSAHPHARALFTLSKIKN